MFNDPIRIPAIIELSLLAIVLIVVSILRVRQQRERARNRAMAEKRRSDKTRM
ncbi:DMSO/TMAO reductase YedYZ heme-binding membrane subunit [Paraburkholderia sp. JPY162]|uniref:DMSO/TMAO reductase YedYZ heme-binding membrane subunit n=1 Tax=Paraburkholderia youngii TaxID=2782701 RepID=A0A7W8L1G3_9BURK|nr:DMSO/TMAO reductase YedYZ heme-binding membrane subunit [Paraburkholderia youngii]